MSTPSIPLLIVEDSPMYAEILQRLLPTLAPELQFQTHWVDSAEKAMECLTQTPYQVVLLDYRLPGANGLEVLAQIRGQPSHEQPAVIMLTGMGNEEIAVAAMKSGAKDYLAKDHLDVPSLLRAITSALERRRLETQLARSSEQLRQKNAEIEADLNLARDVQLAMLPQRYPSIPPGVATADSALQFVHRYLPTGTVGGDFFDVMPLSDTTAAVFICDVMGHGVRAALVTAIIRAVTGELDPVAAEPGQFLTQLNLRLLPLLQRTRFPTFASALYLVMDVRQGELRYANAGHPDGLLVRRSARSVELLRDPARRPGPALGVFEDSAYETAQARLVANDLLVLFTDGLFEVEGSQGERFGHDRLRAAVQERLSLPAAPLFDQLLGVIREFATQSVFPDDVCLVGMEVKKLG